MVTRLERADRIPEIRRRLSPADVLLRRGVAPTSERGEVAWFLCPLHAEKTPSFQSKGAEWHCFGACHVGGDVIDLVERLDGVGTNAAIDIAAELAGVVTEMVPVGRTKPKPVARGTIADEDGQRLLGRFLARRQWDSEVARELGLRVVLDGFGRPRVRFPFYLGHSVVWHQDRLIFEVQSDDEEIPKWLSPSGTHRHVFNANAIPHAHETGELWITEGVFDTVRAPLRRRNDRRSSGCPAPPSTRPGRWPSSAWRPSPSPSSPTTTRLAEPSVGDATSCSRPS